MGMNGTDRVQRTVPRRGRVLGAAVAAGMVASVAVTAVVAPAAGAATFEVTSGLDDGSEGTFRWAVAEASASPGDDVVAIDPTVGTISLTDCVAGRIDLGDGSLTIEGGGATITQTCEAGVLGTDDAATLVLRDLSVTGGDADNGAGVDVPTGSATLERVTLSGNVAVEVGGGLRASTVRIVDSTISENFAKTGGGVAGTGGGPVEIASSTVEGNDATPTGFPFLDTSVPNGRGGGVAVLGSEPARISDSVIQGNVARVGGGGVYSQADLAVDDAVIAGNSGAGYSWVMSGSGGGILTDTGSLVVSRTLLNGNTAGRGGGFAGAGRVEITDTAIGGNVATDSYGGGVTSSLVVTRSAVVGNRANSQAGGGLTATDLTLVDSAVVGNEAGGAAGGLIAETAVVRNSTVVANRAPVNPSISVLDSLRLELATVDGNVGEPRQSGGTISAFGTAFGGGACADLGPITSEGYNVAADGGCGMAQPTDLVDVGDLVLGPLDLNDGPTPNQVPQSGSSLLNRIPADDARCTGTDQRGFVRPQNGACDAGAVEVRAVSAVGTTVNTAGAASIEVDLHPLVTDPDGVLAVYEVDDVVGGSVDGNDEGVVTYAPRPGFDGSGRFAFVVCSLNDVICTNSAIVTITGPALPVSATPRFTG